MADKPTMARDGREIAARIIQRRKAMGLSVQELASKAKMPRSTLTTWEHGTTPKVGDPAFKRLADTLNLPYAVLAMGEDETVDKALLEAFPRSEVMNGKYFGVFDIQAFKIDGLLEKYSLGEFTEFFKKNQQGEVQSEKGEPK